MSHPKHPKKLIFVDLQVSLGYHAFLRHSQPVKKKTNSTGKAQFARNRNHVVRFQQRNMMLKTLRIENHLIECLARQSPLLDHCKPAVVLDGDLMMQKPKIRFIVF